jgi:hypothetical protein
MLKNYLVKVYTNDSNPESAYVTGQNRVVFLMKRAQDMWSAIFDAIEGEYKQAGSFAQKLEIKHK